MQILVDDANCCDLLGWEEKKIKVGGWRIFTVAQDSFSKPRNAEEALLSLIHLARAFQPPAILAAGIETGVLARLARGGCSAAVLTKTLRVSPRGVTMLADAMTALGFLRRRGMRYEMLSIWRPYLDPRSRQYVGGRFAHAGTSLQRWSRLAESVRSGRPIDDLDTAHGASHGFRHIVPALFTFNFADAQAAMRELRFGRRVPRRGQKEISVLDLAAGSGVWGIAAAQANRRTTVTANDYPKILATTRAFAKREGVAKRFRYLPGDLRKVEFGRESFDLAILGLVAHQFSEKQNRALFARIYEALAPGGDLLLVEFAPYDDRSGPVQHPPGFGLNMLLSTPHGDAFSRGDYGRWLYEAGFDRLRVVDRRSGITLLFARRPR